MEPYDPGDFCDGNPSQTRIDPRTIKENELPGDYNGFFPDHGQSSAAVMLNKTYLSHDEAGLGKARLIGCPAISDDGNVVRLVKRQRVYGRV